MEELPDYLRAHWSELREHLLSGAYRPSLVKQQLIPKSGGGMRKLGGVAGVPSEDLGLLCRFVARSSRG